MLVEGALFPLPKEGVPQSEVDALFAEREAIGKEMSGLAEILDKDYVATHKALGKAPTPGSRKKGTGIRGFAKHLTDGTWGMQMFGSVADGSTMLHEFVHVLQGIRDPRTGLTMLRSALGEAHHKKMDKWIRSRPEVKKHEVGSREWEYEYNEQLAETMEGFLRDGTAPKGLERSFALVGSAVGESYKGVAEQPGMKLDAASKATMEELFSNNRVATTSDIANIANFSTLIKGISPNVVYVDDLIILPTTSGAKQVGTKKAKVAEKLAEKLSAIYPDVRVEKVDGRYYAVKSDPSIPTAINAAPNNQYPK